MKSDSPEKAKPFVRRGRKAADLVRDGRAAGGSSFGKFGFSFSRVFKGVIYEMGPPENADMQLQGALYPFGATLNVPGFVRRS
jgi:hypothetical protein